jgi:L-cysteate sulfo-lyase
MDLDRFPRVTLAHLPTPLEPLERLSAHLGAELGGGPRLFIKRDDCTGLAFGGNKTRKLEFLLAEALEARADTVITAGGIQSNHVRQTAAAAAKLGLKAELVLARNVPWGGDDFEHTGNILIDRLLGARIHLFPTETDRAAAMEALAAELREAGARPYVVPVGGSNPTGALGYANCARELAAQAEAMIEGFDYLVFASGSGGTQGGLVAGLTALGHRARAIGIDVDADPPEVEAVSRELAAAVAERLGERASQAADRVEVVAGYAGARYGLPTDAMRRAVELVARLEGILLDPVYSGKAMAGLIGLVEAGRFKASDRVVFLHSGGTPALFAYRSVFEDDGPSD